MTEMIHPAGDLGVPAAGARARWSAERIFYLALSVAITAAMVIGFARTFFFRAWFPEWASAHSPAEPIFYVHGVAFAAWFALLLVQASLVTAGQVRLHRRLGVLGAGLAVVMVILGTIGSLIAAARPTGFIDVPMPPLQFLAVPLADIALFAAFVTLAIMNRRRTQAHKRWMMLGSIALIEASIGRWPFSFMQWQSPVPGYSMLLLVTDFFLLPMVVWDLVSRGRVHPVTLWGGAALIAAQPLRIALAGTSAWLAFAGWAVSLVR